MEKRWQDRWFTGHVSFRLLWLWRVTIYGANAMHWAIQLHTKRWGYLCFHPTTRTFGGRWPWYFYVSRNATPWAATFAIGPGVDRQDKVKAFMRRVGFTSARQFDVSITVYGDA